MHVRVFKNKLLLTLICYSWGVLEKPPYQSERVLIKDHCSVLCFLYKDEQNYSNYCLHANSSISL